MLKELKAELSRCKVARDGEAPLDFAMLFTKKKAMFVKEFKASAKLLLCRNAVGQLAQEKFRAWQPISTKTSIREIGLAAGLVDVKVCAVRACGRV